MRGFFSRGLFSRGLLSRGLFSRRLFSRRLLGRCVPLKAAASTIKWCILFSDKGSGEAIVTVCVADFFAPYRGPNMIPATLAKVVISYPRQMAAVIAALYVT